MTEPNEQNKQSHSGKMERDLRAMTMDAFELMVSPPSPSIPGTQAGLTAVPGGTDMLMLIQSNSSGRDQKSALAPQRTTMSMQDLAYAHLMPAAMYGAEHYSGSVADGIYEILCGPMPSQYNQPGLSSLPHSSPFGEFPTPPPTPQPRTPLPSFRPGGPFDPTTQPIQPNQIQQFRANLAPTSVRQARTPLPDFRPGGAFDEASGAFACHVCGTRFTSVQAMVGHIETAHLGSS